MQEYSPATVRAYDIVRRSGGFNGTIPESVEPVRLLLNRLLTITEGLITEPIDPDAPVVPEPLQPLLPLRTQIDAAFPALNAHVLEQMQNISTTLPLIQSAANDLMNMRKIPRDTENRIIDTCVGSLRFRAAGYLAGALSISYTLLTRLPEAQLFMTEVLNGFRDDFDRYDSVELDPAPFATAMLEQAELYQVAVGSDPLFKDRNQDQFDQLEYICSQIDLMISTENSNIEKMRDNLLTISKTQTLISMRRSGFGGDILDNILSPELLKELDIITKVP